MSNKPENDEKPGFAAPDFKWSEYIQYRPMYPASQYNRIYDYHIIHSDVWDGAHDVGSGPGIVAQDLARKFGKIIVSDPNDSYVKIAEDRLTKEFNYPKDQFTFLQEGAENSSIKDSSVDLIIISQAIHFTDIPVAMKELARQLKSGGTVSINYYYRPFIADNEQVRQIWDKIWDVWAGNLLRTSSFGVRALGIIDSALNVVPFPAENWKTGARRIFINTGGNMDTMIMSLKHQQEAPSRVGENDVLEFVEDDQD